LICCNLWRTARAYLDSLKQGGQAIPLRCEA
jgi:hypothetical protein